jgi:hypothetical protein
VDRQCTPFIHRVLALAITAFVVAIAVVVVAEVRLMVVFEVTTLMEVIHYHYVREHGPEIVIERRSKIDIISVQLQRQAWPD